jgi:hypothetical protein
MIIDTHHHMLPLTYDETAIAKEAERRHIQYGLASRSQQIDLPLEEILRRIIEYTPDPDGTKLIKRMDKAGIDITFLCVMDNIETGMDDAALMAANRTCAEITRKSGGRIMALAGLNREERVLRCFTVAASKSTV